LHPEIADDLRERVALRAKRWCEYRLLHEDHSYWPHQIDHVISLKHDGSSEFENSAYCCLRCNPWKGSDIGSLDGNDFVPLFNPRKSLWQDHFTMRGFVIEPLTAEGRVTARLLRFNIDQRLAERKAIGRPVLAGFSAEKVRELGPKLLLSFLGRLQLRSPQGMVAPGSDMRVPARARLCI